MNKRIENVVLVALLALALGACRDAPKDDIEVVTDVVSEDSGGGSDVEPYEVTGNERWLQPAGTARITFYVDDTANQTFEDGQIKWTGSFAWNSEDNTIAYATSWLPSDGPYPLLYDDGPVREGGHEMTGATAGDHIFSTEVYFKAEEETTFDYGVLNELDFWMWSGANGQFMVPKGSTKTVDAVGMALDAFGTVDVKVTVDVANLNPEFAMVEGWETVNVFVKGNLTMWAPVQVLDLGPDGNKGDDVAEDGVFTFIQSKNLGKHTGLLSDGQKAQFTVVLASGEDTYDGPSAMEYKILSEGTQMGAAEGVEVYISCAGDGVFEPAAIDWELDSWGSTKNTAVVVDCAGTLPPDCTPDDGSCGDGEKCIEGKCKLWCDTDDECGEGEKCIDNSCTVWCDLDDECGEGEKCIENSCLEWCDLDDDCELGFECVDNQCQEKTDVSTPKIISIEPDSGPVGGGSLVTISGTGFLDGATVVFDISPATNVVVVDDGEVSCVTPAHSAWGVDVVLTNPDGGKDKFIKGFEYVDEAVAPVITSADPDEGPVTGGTEVHLYGEHFQLNPTVLFGDNLADGVQYVDSGHVIATSPPGQLGAVDVKLINGDEQEDVLEGGFTYVPNVVDYVKLLSPLGVISIPDLESETVYAEGWEPGVTAGSGAGPGLQVQVGFGALTADPELWLWADAEYHGESGDNDVWKAKLNSDVAGDFRFTFRFSLDGENWVLADAGGSLDGFDIQETGEWAVVEAGDGPIILQVDPKFGSVLGGNSVTVLGAGFDEALTLMVGGTTVVEPSGVSGNQFTFLTPAHAAGPVSFEVILGDTSFTKADAFEYVLADTPTVDGSLEDWDELFLVAENSVVSDWDPELNSLEKLYVAYDSGSLYIGIKGVVEETNYILGYLDIDFGLATGEADMTMLSDNAGSGDLDDALSNVVSVTVPGYGAEYAFGTRGMESYFMGADLAFAEFVGWRKLFPTDNLPWLPGSVVSTAGALEASIPLSSICPDGLPEGGKQMSIVVKISNGYGGFDGVCNQTLPEFFTPDQPEVVGESVTFSVR